MLGSVSRKDNQETMEPELIAYLDERFGRIDDRFVETNQQIVTLREDTNQRFEQLEETIRLTDVKVEGLRDEIRQVADGVAGNNERLDAFREEVARKFDETGALIRLSYDDLDHRVRRLEARAS